MKVSYKKISSVFRNAKKTFAKQWIPPPYTKRDIIEIRKQFWKDFGKAHNMNVTIDGFESNYPIINDTIEFNNEQDYLMFVLRWS